MKRVILLVILMSAATAFLFGQKQKSDEREIRRVDGEFHRALKTANRATLETLLAPNFIWTHSSGEVQSRGLLLADIKSGELIYESLETDDLKVSVYKNSAIVSGHSVRNYPNEKKFQLRYTTFYVKGRNGWQAAALQTAIFPEPRNDAEIIETLLKTENEWAQVDVTKYKSVFQRILAPDFVSTSISGKFRVSRQEYLDAWEYENVKSAVNSDMKVHIYADNVAVVTGIDTTRGMDQNGNEWEHQDRFTDTWVKRKGIWQCVAAQVIRIK
jgi:hypothetical protein